MADKENGAADAADAQPKMPTVRVVNQYIRDLSAGSDLNLANAL